MYRLPAVMAGLVPAIHVLPAVMPGTTLFASIRKGIMRYGGFVYIMTNRPNGTLYVGVTNNIARRAWEHRQGLIEGFTKRHGLKRLVYFERHETIVAAIQREKAMKHWPRAWKVRLIVAANPEWEDLFETLAGY